MKMNVFIPAHYPYRWKYFGVLLLAVLIIMFAAIKTSWVKLPWDIQWIKWGILLALTIMAYSKEKNENERVSIIRIIAQSYAFQFIVSLTIAYYLVIFSFNLPAEMTALDLILMGLVLNTLYFHSAIWFGKKEIQLNYKNLHQIIREDKLLILTWSILTLITILIILFV